MITQILVTAALIIWLILLAIKWSIYFLHKPEEEDALVLLTILWWSSIFIYSYVY